MCPSLPNVPMPSASAATSNDARCSPQSPAGRTSSRPGPLPATGSTGASQPEARTLRVTDDWDGLVTLDQNRRDGYRAHSRQDRSSVYANVGWQPSTDVDLRLFATHIENAEELAGALTRAQ